MIYFHWLTLGALGMMLGYIVLQYFQVKRKEYFYFSAYLLLTLLAFIFNVQFYDKANNIEYLIYHASYSTIPLISFIAYFFFMEHLLELRSNLPFFSKLLRIMAFTILIIVAVDFILYFKLGEIIAHFNLSNIARFLVIIMGITGSFLVMRIGNRESLFFGAGTLILLIAGGITTYLNVYNHSYNFQSDNLLGTGIFYYRSGMIVQILLFAMGISYKMKQIELRKSELEKELLSEKFSRELDKQKAVEVTRQTIAEDLHDDIGATLSSINIFSKIASDQLSVNPQKTANLLDKIGDASQEMMNNMSDVIWAINPEHDSIEKFTFRVKNLIREVLEPNQINYNFIQNISDHTTITMESKRNLFLITKEAVNNVIKYSNASHVEINISSDTHQLFLSISDNGIGFSPNQINEGNGLTNMKNRTQQLGGEYILQSAPGEGTSIQITLPLAKINY